MKAAIALDDWKLPIFRKRLTDAGFDYKDAGAPMAGMTMLSVVFRPDEMQKLQDVVVAAQTEATKEGPPK